MSSPKRYTKRSMRVLPSAKVDLSGPSSFRSQDKWDVILSSDLKLSEKFESVKRTIYGIGFTCVVIMGVSRQKGEEVALKVIMKSKLHSEEELNRARFELSVHSRLTSSYVLPFLASEETLESLILVTPLAMGDLNSLTAHKVLSEGNCRNLCHQLLLGLDYLHNTAGIVHCDIKPANLLVFKQGDELVVRICDFGFAESVSPNELLPYNGLRGSLGYFSPEQLTHQPYGVKVDMFALGIIIFTLLCGYEPFFPSNRCAKLIGGDADILKFESPYWDSVSAEAKAFVCSLLQGHASKRVSALEALDSEWIRSRRTNYLVREDTDFKFKDPLEQIFYPHSCVSDVCVEMTRDQWVQVVVPVASLLACVCGVVLILGFISKGVLSGLSVFIPAAVLGGIAVILIILGTIASTRCSREIEGAASSTERRRRRRDHLSTRQRMEIVSRLTRISDTSGYMMDEEKTCSICLSEDPPERVVLNCGHIYHETCVKEWLRRARFARCPLCRTGLDTPVVEPIEEIV